MLFPSSVFLFLFLPLLLAGYYLFNPRIRNTLLLLASLLFYTWGEGYYLLVLLASIALNYGFGLLVHRSGPTTRPGRYATLLGCLANLALLGSYKYANFVVDNINGLIGAVGIGTIDLAPVHLPIGISFFTFQAMSYLIDVYRGEADVQKNPFRLALYISLFPQLIAGPIVRYHDIEHQLTHRAHSVPLFYSGIKRFIVGLAKKMMIANPLGYVADTIYGLPADSVTFGLAWLAAIAYTLQLYYDFSAYSDMAIGLGRMFGFRFLENFNYPYISRSIREFWRRWHISLSTWFRDYLYIPLGGNRGSPLRVYRNLVLVFFLCGLWHGASWSFVVWGLFHGIFLCLERTAFGGWLERKPLTLQHLYTLLVVVVGWVFFRAENLSYAITFLGAMAGLGPDSNPRYEVLYFLDREIVAVLIVALIGSTPVMRWLDNTVDPEEPTAETPVRVVGQALYSVWLVALGLACMAYVVAQTYNPFIYFRF